MAGLNKYLIRGLKMSAEFEKERKVDENLGHIVVSRPNFLFRHSLLQ